MHEADWITTAITKARQQSPKAQDDTWIELEALLRGKFSDRQLPSGELAGVAKLLMEQLPTGAPGDEEPQ